MRALILLHMLRQGLLHAIVLAALTASGCYNGAPPQHNVARAPTPRDQPGDEAPGYISAESYPSLLIEVDYVKNYAPSNEALERMRQVFQRRLGKPGGVDV